MITTIVSILLLLASIFILSKSAFQWGFYSSQLMHSSAMIKHHERMLEILDDGRQPTFAEVGRSLDLMRLETRRDPNFKEDFLGRIE